MINKNNSKTKEDKNNDIKRKIKTEYSQLLFKESGLNIVEMKHYAKRNKLIMQKKSH